MIIGLVGFKQVGKSTAAKYLQEKYGFERVNMKDALVAEIKKNFPDLLREIGCMYWDLTPEELMEDNPDYVNALFGLKPPIFRALMQNYGTEVRRGDKQTYWTDAWLATVEGLDANVVVDDVRFLNEAATIKLGLGKLVRLTRPDVATGGTHTSETEQLDIVADYTISVDPGDFESLYRELDKIVA